MTSLSELSNNLPLEQQRVRARCFHPTGRFIEFEKDEVEQSIPDRFEKMVRRHPQRIAVKTKNHTLTYRELNKSANRLAHAILARCGTGQQPVALLLENDAPIIAIILAILKAGKICVVLDPSLPRLRLPYMLEDSQASLLLSDRKNLSLASELTDDPGGLMNIDELDAGLSIENPRVSILADDFTYIVYTSGSTGQPKGVIQNHRNGLHEAMLYANGLHICADDRLALLYSCSASQGLKITFGALLNGAALCPFDLQREGVGKLADWLIEQEITIYFSIPVVFREFSSTLTGREKFPKLRVIQLGSDSVALKEVEEYKRNLSANSTLVIRLGSTETGTLRRCYFDRETPLPEKLVPVGYPVEDMEVTVLDDEGNKVGSNFPGEIAVQSRYLSPGYWRRPDLTRAKFLPDPNGGDKRFYLTGDLGRMLPNGCLYHLGRKDFQVKVRGYLIDVAEIEMALADLASIKEAAVVTREIGGSRALVAYLVPVNIPAPSAATLRRALSEKLPEHMVPSAFVILDALLLTPNGKLDRKALPDPGRSRPGLDNPFVPARNPVEKELTRIWAEVLGIDQVGIYDNFFDLGGHSLAAARVVSQVIKQFQSELPLRSLFQSPTVAAMAAAINEYQGKKLSGDEMTRILAELESLSDEEAKFLADHSGTENAKD